ncbi:rRNA maturation RNase YbeY [Aquimarina sp. 2201CG14-23]|uniref:rRNA maturation RNase YbeY n=1 Tax=Aquimarina mycalae TaxID=3040073 RepID=UPI0024780912|nr:rRNA maturation RNase YbeY [Aquimarina sp. 2201CG14-23]MDH7446323.1 rRNA maturation RNase YbeY [Aquimarina sp. 2201CG14-23]
MINFFYESLEFELNEDRIISWLQEVILSEGKKEGDINFIFCNDEYLLKINQEFLAHDTYTDIISFDNSLGNELHGDVFISKERVDENAGVFNVSWEDELRRVIVHGVLHFCGYKDKTEDEDRMMREKENEKLLMFHVER